MIREFARHHMKTEDVKIDEELAHQIWKRGIKHPPRKIRVRMTKTDEGFVLISPYEEEEELETKVEPKEKPKKAPAKEELVEKPKKAPAKEELVEKPKEKPKKAPAKEKLVKKPKKAPAKEKLVKKPKKAPAKIEEKVDVVINLGMFGRIIKEKPAKIEEKMEEVSPKESEQAPVVEDKEEELVEKPKLADFVDQKKDPQHYIDRYNKEKKYRAWFDKNYPNLTIEEAVGLKPTQTKEKPKKAPAKEEKPKKKSD